MNVIRENLRIMPPASQNALNFERVVADGVAMPQTGQKLMYFHHWADLREFFNAKATKGARDANVSDGCAFCGLCVKIINANQCSIL